MKPTFLEEFDFFAGVPDSQLKALTAFLFDRYGISSQHVIAANEGNAVALAAGYHLATGKVPVVYLQNSGLGNIINPVASPSEGIRDSLSLYCWLAWGTRCARRTAAYFSRRTDNRTARTDADSRFCYWPAYN